MLQTTLALILFLFPLAYSPGPGNMVFAANGARFGVRATLSASAGYHIATWIITAAIGLGFVELLGRFPGVFTGMRVLGAGYVLWLAWRLSRAGNVGGRQTARPMGFVGGTILLLLNPKAYVIIALMFTQFLGPAESGLAAVLLITTIFTLNNLMAFTVWSYAGDRIAARFRSPDSARCLNRVFGGVLALVAVWMAVA